MNIILYSSEDGKTKLALQTFNQQVWLSQADMAELYQTTKQNISKHIKAIFDENELDENLTVNCKLTVQQEGTRKVNRQIACYSLPLIIAVGYRVRSARGTQFRQWATERLSEYLVKGFTMDDERLKGLVGAIIGKNCLSVFGIFVQAKKPFTAKCWIYMPQAKTIILIAKKALPFSKLCKINCIMQPVNILQRN